MKAERLQRIEQQEFLLGRIPRNRLQLVGSDWISLDSLREMLLEDVTSSQYEQFRAAMDYLASLPYSFVERNFIMKFRLEASAQIKKTLESLPVQQRDEKGRAFADGFGVHKSTRAWIRVWANGTGKYLVDGLELDDFMMQVPRESILFPFIVLNRLGHFDIEGRTEYGGESAKATAIRLATCRALCAFVSPQEMEMMRLAGLLSYDPRKRERKKPGLRGARARKVWRKR